MVRARGGGRNKCEEAILGQTKLSFTEEYREQKKNVLEVALSYSLARLNTNNYQYLFQRHGALREQLG